MKYLILLLVCVAVSCQSNDQRLEEGRWIGSLSPMSHPDMENPVAYAVSYNENDELEIILIGPSGDPIQTRKPELKADTLTFSFKEPEEQVFLNCKLVREQSAFSGKCTDMEGKWAQFTMNPPQ
ncbi:hypothetical protein [Fodinibius halophilus]|uniref:TIGR03067 domain-containing protein n=1 Tax=Fodinibius halophilus TaxID=1736908 RepID=A0A6M1T267_9BACT|nr:hypothetical protein [Fodinibius halophilus]NGP88089.1 hypothetical protein [Fodinibius halophilus]